jgi:hypothetical protein
MCIFCDELHYLLRDDHGQPQAVVNAVLLWMTFFSGPRLAKPDRISLIRHSKLISWSMGFEKTQMIRRGNYFFVIKNDFIF